MLETKHFAEGENEHQLYYYFTNEVTNETVQVIRNKPEQQWFGLYDMNGSGFIIPVPVDINANIVLERVCNWYNKGKREPYYTLPLEVKETKVSKTIRKIRSMNGEMSLEHVRRIQAYINEPTVERWDDISGIIIDGHLKTVWEAVCEDDPTFPRKGPSKDITGQVMQGWTRVPAPLKLLRAIEKATQ